MALLTQASLHIPEVLGFLLLFYAHQDFEPELLFRVKSKFRVILSREGTQQGDPFGPLLFALGIAPALQAIKQSLPPAAVVLAYLDDIIMLVPRDWAARALQLAQENLMLHLGLLLRLDKCVIFDPHGIMWAWAARGSNHIGGRGSAGLTHWI